VGTERESILAFRRPCRKHPVLPVLSTTKTGSRAALSIEMITAAWDLPVGSTDKLVLLALADHVNKQDINVCWPSIARLCKRTGLTGRAVNKSLKRLKEAGHIEVIHRHRRANHFTLNLAPGTLNLVHPSPNVVRLYPEPGSQNPEPRSLLTCKESESESEHNFRAESVKDAGAEKAPEAGVFERKEAKHSEEVALTAWARVLCFRAKMGDETWSEYREKLRKHESDNPVNARLLYQAVERRRPSK